MSIKTIIINQYVIINSYFKMTLKNYYHHNKNLIQQKSQKVGTETVPTFFLSL